MDSKPNRLKVYEGDLQESAGVEIEVELLPDHPWQSYAARIAVKVDKHYCAGYLGPKDLERLREFLKG